MCFNDWSKRKVRLQIVNINSDEPVFYPLAKASKCSGCYGNINDPYAKMCVPDVVKNLNVFNLMSITNETRHIEWHETCKCKCRLDASVFNNKQRWNDDIGWCECKELWKVYALKDLFGILVIASKNVTNHMLSVSI